MPPIARAGRANGSYALLFQNTNGSMGQRVGRHRALDRGVVAIRQLLRLADRDWSEG